MDIGALQAVGYAIRQAMKLNPQVFVDVARSPNGIYFALTIVALAGLSETIGQSLILFVNRVRPRRFIPAVLIGVLSYVIGYLLWTASVFLVVRYGFDVTASWVTIAAVVGVAYAPQVLSFFELTPFFGNAFGILLTLWSMLAVIVAIIAGLDLTLGQAVFAAGLGWLLLQLVRRTVGIPANRIWRWFRAHAIGSRLQYSPSDLPQLRRRAASWLNQEPAPPLDEPRAENEAK